MKAICSNHECEAAVHKKELDVERLDSKCPSCGEKSLLPVTAKEYIDEKDHMSSKRISEIKKNLKKHGLDDSKRNNDKKSLKSIEFSYKKKMASLEKELKNDKILKKFKKMDNNMMDAEMEIENIEDELKKVDSIFKSFKRSDANQEKKKVSGKTQRKDKKKFSSSSSAKV